MSKNYTVILCFYLVVLFVQTGFAKPQNGQVASIAKGHFFKNNAPADSAAARNEVMNIINTVVKASGTFDIDAVADLYTPNAVVADEEPPFSWNGSTAGVQWVNTVEKTCKDFKLKNFNGKIRNISVYLQTSESIYVVVPVDYSGDIKGDRFDEEGAFTFVFRLVNGRWLIKSQVWVARKGM
jgi:ketosteroid isomerase-like protein